MPKPVLKKKTVTLPRHRMQGLSSVAFCDGSPAFMETARLNRLSEMVKSGFRAGLSEVARTSNRVAGLIASDPRSGNPAYMIVNGVAQIPVVGVLTKYPSLFDEAFGLCPAVVTLAMVDDALQDPDVHSIILKIDCPGGAVNGTVELAYAVREANKAKPVIGFISGLCCSGGYYVASQCGRIVSAPSSEIGSIGVYCVLTDYSQALADEGVVLTRVASGQFKGLGSDGRVTTDYVADQQRIIDGMHLQFVADIVAGRGMEITDVLAVADGRTFLPLEAIQAGLVDSIGTEDEVCAALVTTTTKKR